MAICATAAPGSAPADEVVRHISSSSWSWPGRDATLDDYLASGTESLTARLTTPTSGQVTGGFARSLRLMSRYGTYSEIVAAPEIDRLVRTHSRQVQLTPEFAAVIRMVAADRGVFRVLERFLGDGGTLAPILSGGRYTPDPLRIIVGVAPRQDRIDAGKTLFHELLHYAFDKVDSVLAEVHSAGGADHYAINQLEERFLLIQSLRAGRLPLFSEYGSLYGFTRMGKIGERFAAFSRAGDFAGLAGYLATDEYRTNYVHSAMVTVLSSRAFNSRQGGDYVLTDAQTQDLASLAAYHASMLAGGIELAAAPGGFGTSRFAGAFRAFLPELVRLREREPLGSPRAQAAEAVRTALSLTSPSR